MQSQIDEVTYYSLKFSSTESQDMIDPKNQKKILLFTIEMNPLDIKEKGLIKQRRNVAILSLEKPGSTKAVH